MPGLEADDAAALDLRRCVLGLLLDKRDAGAGQDLGHRPANDLGRRFGGRRQQKEHRDHRGILGLR